MRKVLFDTSTYSNFARTKNFWILEKLYGGRMVITHLVRLEIEKGIKRHRTLKEIFEAIDIRNTVEEIRDVTEKEFEFMTGFHSGLSETDKLCVAIAVHRGYTLASDDYDVVKEARSNMVHIIGTIDILEESVEHSLILCDEAKRILKEMQKRARFLAPRLIDC